MLANKIATGDPRSGKIGKKGVTMRFSARNQLKCKVKSVEHGAVNSEIVLQLPGGAEIVAIITRSSAETLRLEPGRDAYAIVKASSVMVGTD